jgi:hypothetical protein
VPGSLVDRTIDTTATKEGSLGCIDYGVYLESGDVSSPQGNERVENVVPGKFRKFVRSFRLEMSETILKKISFSFL